MADGYLSDSTLLSLWERGTEQTLSMRALQMLSAAFPQRNAAELEALPIGQRDRLLMQVRQQTFGQELSARAKCPACGELLELIFPLAQILNSMPERESSDTWFNFDWQDWNISFRLPNGGDFVVMAECGDSNTARQYLLERCIRSKHCGQSADSSAIPTEVLDRVREQISILDPLSDIQLAMNCAICGVHWNTRLEMVIYLWTEICAEAQLILQEVHQLASTYHWRESDILMMSRQRRRYYIGLMSHA
jgi:hypothetical protein